MARYPGATFVAASPKNIGGPIGHIRLGVEHIEQGSESGTNSWFQNPAAQVSAHFGIAKTGQVFQFVDTNTIAWAEMSYNDVAISVEHEGMSGSPLTPEQVEADAKLYVWLFKTHGIPLARTTDPNGSGWIGHGELGIPGGDHINCPGNPVLAQMPAIIAKAKSLLTPPKPPLTRYPSTADLTKAGLVALQNPQEAQIALTNGWALWGWNGTAFVPFKARLLSGSSQYASESYAKRKPKA
jgi:N-acetylmuramoyl-L-alanine amidase